MAPIILTPKTSGTIRLRQEGDRVLIISDGKTVANMPWESALELARKLTGIARKAEEHSKRDAIIFDQAILTRAGFQLFGLTNDPWMMKQAGIEAAWNSDLRRYMPGAGGIQSGEIVGTPTVVRHAPTEKQRKKYNELKKT